MGEVKCFLHWVFRTEGLNSYSPGHFGSLMEDSGPSWHGERDDVSSEDGETNVNQSLEGPH